MSQFIEIEQKSSDADVFKILVWGLSAFFGVITYLNHFPMNYSLLNIDWLFIVNGGKVIMVAIATGYLGSIARKVGEYHWERLMKYFKNRKNKTIKK